MLWYLRPAPPAADPRLLRGHVPHLLHGLRPARATPSRALFGDKQPSPAVIEAICASSTTSTSRSSCSTCSTSAGCSRGDLGTTFSGRPVIDELARAFPITVPPGDAGPRSSRPSPASLVGLIAGLRKGKLFDATALVVSPAAHLGADLRRRLRAAVRLRHQARPFRTTVSSQAPWNELVLPAIVLASVSFAYIVRLTRACVAENMSADFVRTATAKGLPRRRVVGVHILRNSLDPRGHLPGRRHRLLMVGAIVTEGIFNIHGVGGTVYRAVKLGEGPTVVVLRRRDGHHLHARQPPGRPALRRPRPEDPLCQVTPTPRSADALRRPARGDPPHRRSTRSTSRREAPSPAGPTPGSRCGPARCSGSPRSLILLIIVVAVFPGLFTARRPDASNLDNSDGGPEAGHLLGFTRRAPTSTPA